MTALWIVPPLVLTVGAFGMARLLAEVARRTDEVRLAVVPAGDIRAAATAVRDAADDARDSFHRLQQR